MLTKKECRRLIGSYRRKVRIKTREIRKQSFRVLHWEKFDFRAEPYYKIRWFYDSEDPITSVVPTRSVKRIVGSDNLMFFPKARFNRIGELDIWDKVLLVSPSCEEKIMGNSSHILDYIEGVGQQNADLFEED